MFSHGIIRHLNESYQFIERIKVDDSQAFLHATLITIKFQGIKNMTDISKVILTVYRFVNSWRVS
jgi:hypothetical protein